MDSAKHVATARTEFCSLPLRFPEDDELLFFSDASILVCIASSAFVFPSIFASTLEACIVVLSHRRQNDPESCCDFVVILLCQSHDRFVILFYQSLHVVFLQCSTVVSTSADWVHQLLLLMLVAIAIQQILFFPGAQQETAHN